MSLLLLLGGNTSAVFLTPFAFTYGAPGSVLILITDWIRLYFQEPYFGIWRGAIPDVEVVIAFLQQETVKVGLDDDALMEKASYFMPPLKNGSCYALWLEDWMEPMQHVWKRRERGCLRFDSIPNIFIAPIGWYLSPTIVFAEDALAGGPLMQYPGTEMTEARRSLPPFVEAFNYIQRQVFKSRVMRDEEDKRHVGLCWNVFIVLEPSLV